tara:strand:+ start:22531 stop:22788 length:258 start_codon:yes stop_codon:yes gene_type:complete
MFKTKVNKIDQFKTRADNALSVFRKSYQDMLNINKEINAVIEGKQVEIDNLEKDKVTLDLQFTDNHKVARKIGDILGEKEEVADA